MRMRNPIHGISMPAARLAGMEKISPNSPKLDMNEVIRLSMSASAMTFRSPERIWLTSCARIPASWRTVSPRSSPSVMAMAESSGLPTANAFIIWLGT